MTEEHIRHVTVELAEEMRDEVEARAEIEGKSRAQWIREAAAWRLDKETADEDADADDDAAE